jgi:voltage-gated potassium channel Kch
VPEPRGRSNVTLLRFLFVLIGAAALGLGDLGVTRYLDVHKPQGYDRFDVPYFTLQLFVLGSEPLQNGGPFPWQLEVARFLAPLFTLAAVVETARVLLAGEIRRIRARLSRGHTIVCGDTPFARALIDQLLAGGQRVIRVQDEPFGEIEAHHDRVITVVGDPRSAATLRGAGLGRARYVYICGDDDQVNHAVSVAASGLPARHRRLPWIYVQINRPSTCHALQARRLGAAGASRFRLDYFHVDDVAARVLYRRHELHPPTDAAPVRLAIAGDGTFAAALLVETARHWHASGGTRDGLQVDLIAPDAAAIAARLGARFAFLDRDCRIVPRDGAVDAWLSGLPADQGYHRIYLCPTDEAATLDQVLASPCLWAAVSGAVFLAGYRQAALAQAFHGERHNDLLDEINGKLVMYPIETSACDAGLITDDLTERMARQVHARYLGAARGDTTTASHVSWETLSESLRNANRAQVQGIAVKMQALNCVIAVRNGHDEVITGEDVERLAELEHERWSAERGGQGWRYGPTRIDRRRRHPDLVPWDDLCDESKEKDRDAVRWITEILADEGFTIVRLSDGASSDDR